MQRLTRREILKALKRQGIYGLSRIKAETRRFERYWDKRIVSLARKGQASGFQSHYGEHGERAFPSNTNERSGADA